jgi:hypothetical protein
MVPIKLRRPAWRLAKSVAAALDMSAVDYLSKVILESASRDLDPMPSALVEVMESLRKTLPPGCQVRGKEE